MGGQRTIRAFWRHYFECTDGLIWVVDSADQHRMQTCKEELHRLLKEEVRLRGPNWGPPSQGAAGALGACASF